MTHKRKTIAVSEVRLRINQMLMDSCDECADERQALAVFLEHLLMDTGNYKGFRFTDGASGSMDDTRRLYYGSAS